MNTKKEPSGFWTAREIASFINELKPDAIERELILAALFKNNRVKDMAAWHEVAFDGLPPCDEETVFLGENSAGYLCTFTWVNPNGVCVQGSPEAVTAQFSDLRFWRIADRPKRDMP
jgi:hypothetical protein